MKKKDKKSRKQRDPEETWVKDWCESHVDELQKRRGRVLVLHPSLGIVFDAPNAAEALAQTQHLKKRISRDTYLTTADEMLTVMGLLPRVLRTMPRPDAPMDPHRQKLAKGWKKSRPKKGDKPEPVKRMAAQKPVPETADPPPLLATFPGVFDPGVTLDGSAAPVTISDEDIQKIQDALNEETLEQVAKRLGKKATEVLIKVLAWPNDERPEGVNIHTRLSRGDVRRIEEDFSSFPSPDPQPPFMPRPSTGFDRDAVIDGGGAAYRRSTRID